jgi:diguanylate cyclase (GGDEF)-like protein/PAS domain S-box-containing protein
VRRFRGAVVFAVGLTAVHVLWLLAKIGGDTGVTAASDLIQLVAPAAAGVICAARSRREARGQGRLAWGLLAAAMAAWAAGTATWTIYEVAFRVEVPFPSLADAGFLAMVPLAAAGVLAFPGGPRRILSSVRTILDGAIIGGSVLLISWVTVLGPVYREHADGALQQILTLAYPLGDVVIVTAVLLVLARSARGSRSAFALLAGGLLVLGLTDSTFLFLDLRGLYSTGSLIDVGWTAGPLLIMLAALRTQGLRRKDHSETASKAAVILPYVPATLALATSVVVVVANGKLEGFLLWNGLGIVLALLLRQFIILVDNLSLSRDLEHRVEARTSELRTSEERFRSLVQNSSDFIAIVSQDAEFTYVSPSAARVIGYEADSFIGKALVAHVHEDDRSSVIASIADALANPGSSIVVECRVGHRDGYWSDLEILMTNLLWDRSVEGIVLNARDVTERKRLEEQLGRQAFTDPLTGLANRVVFRDRVEHALRRGERLREHLGVIFLDLDGFKAVNDSLGHAAGDALLIAFGERLGRWVRPGDTVARLGGDEFGILLEGIFEPLEAESIARRIVENSKEPYSIEGRELYVGVSIGIALRTGSDDSAELLLRNADVAMYIAKAHGKSRYEVFHPEMAAPILARLEIESELRTAIEHGDLRVYYQPIVELPGGRISALEALVRWEHPERGLIPPDQFIPVAEDTGLIHQIGTIVLNEACDALQSLQPSMDGPVYVSVNLSAAQFGSPKLAEVVAHALRRSGLAPELLVLEITETVVMADTEATVDRLRALKRLGVRVAIDDFGTGYSSLNYLRRFPVDVLKIDRAFVRNVDASAEDSALAQAILKLAQTFKLEAVAEGIERTEQLDVLVHMGCRFGQGFLFARPQPMDDIAKLLARRSGVASA